MIICEKPITLKELIDTIFPKREFDYVTERIYTGNIDAFTDSSDTIAFGEFAISHTNGLHLVSLDGDTYDLDEIVIAYEEWFDPNNKIYNGLTIIVAGEYITPKKSNPQEKQIKKENTLWNIQS